MIYLIGLLALGWKGGKREIFTH